MLIRTHQRRRSQPACALLREGHTAAEAQLAAAAGLLEAIAPMQFADH